MQKVVNHSFSLRNEGSVHAHEEGIVNPELCCFTMGFSHRLLHISNVFFK